MINKMFIRHFIGGQRWMNSFENKKKIAHWNWYMHLFRCQILSIVFRPIPFPPPLCLWHRENCIKKWIYVAYFMRIVTDFGSVLPSFDMKSICWNALRLKCTRLVPQATAGHLSSTTSKFDDANVIWVVGGLSDGAWFWVLITKRTEKSLDNNNKHR